MDSAGSVKTAQEVERIFEAHFAANELLRSAAASVPGLSDQELLYAFLVGSVKLARRPAADGATEGERWRRLFDLLMLVYVEVDC